LERQFGILEDSACKAREVMLASVATETSVLALCTVVLATVRANHVVAQTSLYKCLLAYFLTVEVVDYCDNGVEFRKIYHINTFFTNYFPLS
jgi:hypothetical protein